MANADALSRLPLKTSQAKVPRPPDLVHLTEHLDSTPLSCTQIRMWTDHDPTLSRVTKWVQDGWPAPDQKDKQDLQPYYQRKDELSMEGVCVLWGNWVVVPIKGRKRALNLLHKAHPGIVRMKSLARGYMWWPGMNKDIHFCVKECTVCQFSRKMPPTARLHPWARLKKPWSRVHRLRRTPRKEDVPPDDRCSLEMAGNPCHKILDIHCHKRIAEEVICITWSPRGDCI